MRTSTVEELIEAVNAEPKRGMSFLAFEKYYWSAQVITIASL
jgi:hypothetical protein